MTTPNSTTEATPLQGLAAYLRCEAGGVFSGHPSHATLLRWASEIEATAKAPEQGETALLFEHEDGRYAVNPDTTGDPKWHRLGPVDLPAAYGHLSPAEWPGPPGQVLTDLREIAATQTAKAAPVEGCPDKTMEPFACKNRAQCWEPCGELGHSAKTARVAPASPQPLAPPPGCELSCQTCGRVEAHYHSTGADGALKTSVLPRVAQIWREQGLEVTTFPPSSFVAQILRDSAPQPPASVQPLAVGVETELEEMRQRKDAAYLERNQVVAALAKCFPSGVGRTAIEGWSEDWHGCVYIDLPTGQASWHFHDSQAYLFEGLPNYAGSWDGHDTPEKYRRLAALPIPEQCTANGPQACWRVRCNLGNSCVAAAPPPPGGMVPLTPVNYNDPRLTGAVPCPIGLDMKGSESFCSAGYCDKCKARRGAAGGTAPSGGEGG